MFEQIKAAPRDAILGITESFREDPIHRYSGVIHPAGQKYGLAQALVHL